MWWGDQKIYIFERFTPVNKNDEEIFACFHEQEPRCLICEGYNEFNFFFEQFDAPYFKTSIFERRKKDVDPTDNKISPTYNKTSKCKHW